MQICPLSLHDALPISRRFCSSRFGERTASLDRERAVHELWTVRSIARNNASAPPRITEGRSPPKPNTNPCARARSKRSEEHTSELQSQSNLVCRLLLE